MSRLKKGNYIRICGQIDGSMEDMLPCLFIGDFGVGAERNSRMKKSLAGIFVLGEPSGNGACPCKGLIIPLHRIQDETLRCTLLNLQKYLCNETNHGDYLERVTLAQLALDNTLKGCLTISRQCTSLTNMIHFDRVTSKSIYKLLAGQADYVAKIREESNGKSIATAYEPFTWNNYYEFTEWFNEVLGDKRWGISLPSPSLIFDNASALADYADTATRSQLVIPGLNPAAFFSIRPDVVDQSLNVKINMETSGWANMELSLGLSDRVIYLSNVYPPFEPLIEWLKLIDQGNLPVQIEIDEEGIETCLTAYPTESHERLYFTVSDKYDVTKVSIQAIINRIDLVNTFRDELRRFFAEDFDAEEWDSDDSEESPLLLRIKSDNWINDNT